MTNQPSLIKLYKTKLTIVNKLVRLFSPRSPFPTTPFYIKANRRVKSPNGKLK